MSGAGVVLSTLGFGSVPAKTLRAASTSLKPEEQALENTIQEVDRLYDQNKMKEALAYLERCSDSPEAELLWRLARLCYKVSSYIAGKEDMVEGWPYHFLPL